MYTYMVINRYVSVMLYRVNKNIKQYILPICEVGLFQTRIFEKKPNTNNSSYMPFTIHNGLDTLNACLIQGCPGLRTIPIFGA